MALHLTALKISDKEHRARAETLLRYLQEHNLSGVILFDSDYVKYYSGFTFIPTERPMAFLMNDNGERALFVPRLELEHAQSHSIIDRVEHYPEYPDNPHPMERLKTLLAEMGLAGEIAADSNGYPWIFGYRGPTLTELTGVVIHFVRAFIEDEMAIKSQAEITCLKVSSTWANLAHTLLQRYTRPGLTETEVTQRASTEATQAMMDAIGPIYRAQSGMEARAYAGYRGQIGRNAAIPHALANNIVFQPGDVLVTGATAPVWGYVSELERTMFIGQPGDEHHHLFDHMLALQTLAIEALEPGKPCSSVDQQVRSYFSKHDLMPYWKHHTGHTIGLRYHEGPFLDSGDHTTIKPGMVFTVEPGLYAPGIGGFRHSDTVVITEDGHEVITYYPRDLESLIIPA
jgi:Xaa-Pro aminopeptidase